MPPVLFMDVFLPNGYLNVPAIRATGYPFIYIWGGRATGKTYGTLKDVMEKDEKFVFMRRKQTQLDAIAQPDLSPFRKLTDDGVIGEVEQRKITQQQVGFYVDGRKIGVGVSLRTIANIRGFDASDCSVIVYDEFIKERHEATIRGESDALLNAYETINRNRELQGQKPVQLICLANANDVANPIFMGLNLVSAAIKLHNSNRDYMMLPQRGVLLVDLKNSPISQEKRQTALYKLTQGTDFARMALDNDFSYNDISGAKSRPLAEYDPVVFVGELAVYRHKSNDRYYVTGHRKGAAPVYSAGSVDLARFQRAYAWLWFLYLQNQIDFEEYYGEALFTQYFKG